MNTLCTLSFKASSLGRCTEPRGKVTGSPQSRLGLLKIAPRPGCPRAH